MAGTAAAVAVTFDTVAAPVFVNRSLQGEDAATHPSVPGAWMTTLLTPQVLQPCALLACWQVPSIEQLTPAL